MGYSNLPQPSHIVRGVYVQRGTLPMSAKALQNLSFWLLIALTFYVAFGGGL